MPSEYIKTDIMNDFYMLSDAELAKMISSRLKALRLKQNISRQELSASCGVSTSSIARMEDGEIKSFDSFLRVLRTLGKIEILRPLVEEEEVSPKEYYQLVHSAKVKTRKRASERDVHKEEEASQW